MQNLDIIEIPNALGSNYSDKIEYLVTSLHFPWYFLEDVTYVSDENNSRIPGFAHLLYDRQTSFEGNELAFLSPVLFHISSLVGDKMMEFLRMKVNLLFPGDGNPNNRHTDFDFPHKTIVYYVNDSDGDTVFYSGNDIVYRCKPEKNKAVIFDGLIEHSSTCPVECNRRIVMNMNYRNYSFEGEK
jgi:hypothetical protein